MSVQIAKGKLRALLLEDRASDAELILHELMRTGFELESEHVQNEAEYLARLDKGWDVILADYNLPNFDAPSALRLLRERNLDIPFIIVSGTIGEELAVEAMMLGAADYLLKDRLGRLGAAISRVMDERKERGARRHADQALAESEARYRLLVECAPDAILVHCEGKVRFANPAAQRLLGVESVEQLLDSPYLEILHPDYRASALERMAKIEGGQTPLIEKKILRRNGSSVEVEATGIPFIYQGKPAIQVILHDLTGRNQAKAELRRAHGKLQHVLTHSPAMLYTLKVEGNKAAPVVISDNIQLHLGVTAAETGRFGWWMENLHPEDRDRVLSSRAAVLQSDGYSMEYRVRHGDGNYRWLEDHSRVVRDVEGRAEEAVGVWTDITKRKEAEIRLAERNRLAALVSDVGVALTVSDSFSSGLQRCTDSIQNHFEAVVARIWTLDETENVLELRATSGHDPEQTARYLRVPVGQLKIGLIAAERRCHWTNDLIHDLEFTNLEWARREGVIAFAGCPLIVHDHLVGVMAIFSRHALTDSLLEGLFSVADQVAIGVQQMQGEKSLQESEERYRDLFENAHDLIQSVAPDGRFIYVNRAWHDSLGYTEEDLKQLQLLDLVPPERFQEVQNILRRVMADEPMKVVELELNSKEGKRIALEGSINTKREKGQIVSLRFILRDVTEKKKWEAQSLRNQRMESIGTLAGGIAHDLNNALAPILMSLELLRLKFTDLESASLLETIATSAQRGAEMVKQVLTFSRGLEGQKVEVQLRHIIGDMQKVMKQTFPKNLHIRASSARDLWTVTGDATQLHQVLLNLCVNARDAMPKGGNLTIRAENCVLDEHFAQMNREAKPGPYVILNVADSGTGIATDIQDRIFDPFFTTKPVGEGTGLGLSTVRGIVKGHSGFVSVYSELGKGTLFKVYLPAHALATTESAVPTPDMLPRGRGEMILVVDDEASVRTIAKQTLTTFGYEVVTASDGADAVAMCAQHQFKIKLVLIDVVMPIMDGPTAIKAIRTILPQVKIIAASGLPIEGSSNELERFRPNGTLHKPYTAERLLHLMHEILADPAVGS